jgi:hypothetical protein
MKKFIKYILIVFVLLPLHAYVQTDTLLPWHYIDSVNLQDNPPVPYQVEAGDELESGSLLLSNSLAGIAPSDILYVASQNKYFVYGYHRIVVIDASTREFIDAVEISDYGRQYKKNYGLLSYQESNNLAYNHLENEVYCFTEDQKLIAIDASNHQVKAVIKNAPENPNSVMNVYWNHYIQYDSRTNMIFLAIAFPELYDDYKTVIHIYSGAPPYAIIKTIYYDRHIYGFRVNSDFDKIYVTCKNRFEVIDFTGSVIATQELPATTAAAGNLLYINDVSSGIHRAICFPGEQVFNLEERKAYYFNGNDDLPGSFDILRQYITSAVYNPQQQRIYLAHNDGNYGIDIINAINNTLIQSVEFGQFNNLDKRIRHLTLFNNKIFGSYAKSQDDVKIGEGAFSLNTTSHSVNHFGDVPYGHVSRLVVNNQNNEVVTANFSHGSLSFISATDNSVVTLHTGGSVFTGTYNNVENKSYSYNQKVAKLYINNLNDNTSTTIDFGYLGIGGYISDVVFDEARNRVYVAFYANTNKVKIIDGVTDQLLETEISLTDTYCRKLFIGKNDKLYSVVGPNDYGKRMVITDLNTYQYIGFWSLGGYYQSIFAWFALTKDDNIILSYSLKNEDFGKVMIFDKNSNTLIKFFESKSLARLAYNPLNNKVYNQRVIYTDFGTIFTNEVLVTNLDHDTQYTLRAPEKVFDLTYCAKDNVLALFKPKEFINGQPIPPKLTMINGNNEDLISHEEIPNSASGIKYNPLNGRLYTVHPAMMDEIGGNLGRIEVQSIDYFNSRMSRIITGTNETIGIAHELLFSTDNVIHNTIDNQLLIPAGFHSKIIVVDCAEDELLLNNRYNWVSFPRLEREGNEPFNTRTLLERLQPLPERLNMEGRDPQDHASKVFYKEFDDWFDDQIPAVQSSRGYKLNTSDGSNILPLYGSILAPDTPMEVFAGYDNWVGYFLQHSQSPLDAFAHLLPYLSAAKGYGWLLHTGAPIEGPGGEPVNIWRVDPADARIRYGDMAIVRVKSDRTFMWSPDGEPGPKWEPSLTDYFTYDEKADYAPIIIELDSINKPDEIGAFINDSCVGACKVESADSTVLLRAFLSEGSSGDSLSFQMHYATKSTQSGRIKTYYVFDEQKRRSERRAIKTGERKNIYYVSLKDKPADIDLEGDEFVTIQLHPNPAKDNITVNYSLSSGQDFTIEVLDMQGRSVALIERGYSEAGSYSIVWNALTMGVKLQPGMYVVRLQTNRAIATAKLLIMQP